jgi:hypothetical protein
MVFTNVHYGFIVESVVCGVLAVVVGVLNVCSIRRAAAMRQSSGAPSPVSDGGVVLLVRPAAQASWPTSLPTTAAQVWLAFAFSTSLRFFLPLLFTSQPPAAAGFPEYNRRLGVCLALVALTWSIDFTGSFGLYPLPVSSLIVNLFEVCSPSRPSSHSPGLSC